MRRRGERDLEREHQPDVHLRCSPAYSGRPSRDAAHMTEELVASHVARVLSQLRGRHHLVAGNHDTCHSSHRRGASRVRRYLDAGFLDVQESFELELPTLGGVDLCHMPYVGDHTDRDRYVDHRPADRGRWLLHAHVHELWRRRDRMINVGVDQGTTRPSPSSASSRS